MYPAGSARARACGGVEPPDCSTVPSASALAMGDDGGATGVAEPASQARASQPSAQNARRRSARLDGDEDPELVALTAADLPAHSQRAALDARPVGKEEEFQVGTRVSCLAKCFDSKDGLAWSKLTFGEGGGGTRIFGTVREVLDDSGGRGRKCSTYRIRWDIVVPQHDPNKAANANSLGRKAFTKGQLRREDPSAGKRLTANLSSPASKPTLQHTVDPEDGADDSSVPAPKDPRTLFVDASITDDEDEAWEPAKDSAGESDDECPTELRDDLLLSLEPTVLDMGKWNGHEVVWSFGGCSQEAMDGAALPWSLDSGNARFGPASDPYRDSTQFATEERLAGAAQLELDKFMKFYPGGFDAMCDDVDKVNAFGADRLATADNPWSPITVWDWLAFLAVLFGNTRSEGSWQLLFDSGDEEYTALFGRPTFKNLISKSRFERIRRCAHTAFNSTDRQSVQYDPWMPFREFVHRYNTHMVNLCKFGRYWVLDESMSPYQPRADKYGGLPHLSYIQRKQEAKEKMTT